jgi:hypothetical protein
VDPFELPSAVMAGVSSLVAFSLGALVPLLPYLVGLPVLAATRGISSVALAVAGIRRRGPGAYTRAAAIPAGGRPGSQDSQRGRYQHRSPSSDIIAGSRIPRTTVASMSTAAASCSPRPPTRVTVDSGGGDSSITEA